MIEDTREIVGAFVRRIVNLVNTYHKPENRTTERDAVIAWVRNNSNLHQYWHRRYVSKAQMKILVTNLCTAIINFSALPQCPDPGAILNLIYDDADLVEWCESQGIIT